MDTLGVMDLTVTTIARSTIPSKCPTRAASIETVGPGRSVMSTRVPRGRMRVSICPCVSYAHPANQRTGGSTVTARVPRVRISFASGIRFPLMSSFVDRVPVVVSCPRIVAVTNWTPSTARAASISSEP